MMKEVDSWLSHFFAENNDVLCLLTGVLLIIGAWKNWNWLCDPVGKPYNTYLTRGLLRLIFCGCGFVLVVSGAWLLLYR